MDMSCLAGCYYSLQGLQLDKYTDDFSLQATYIVPLTPWNQGWKLQVSTSLISSISIIKKKCMMSSAIGFYHDALGSLSGDESYTYQTLSVQGVILILLTANFNQGMIIHSA